MKVKLMQAAIAGLMCLAAAGSYAEDQKGMSGMQGK